eukprot:COSAG01_NODE_404_length_17467_cov_69.758650_10_plen_142_part_00
MSRCRHPNVRVVRMTQRKMARGRRVAPAPGTARHQHTFSFTLSWWLWLRGHTHRSGDSSGTAAETGFSVFVGNLAFAGPGSSLEELKQHFGRVEGVQDVKLIMKAGGKSKGAGCEWRVNRPPLSRRSPPLMPPDIGRAHFP